jgi:hypothetical protein
MPAPARHRRRRADAVSGLRRLVIAKFVWIASYPRSGNTWMRFLLANLLYGRVSSTAALQDMVPDIHRGLVGAQLHGARKTLIKTHWRFAADLPLREDTMGAIYIVRHPVDVLISNLNYVILRAQQGGELQNEAQRREFERRFIDSYVQGGGYQRWREMGFGSWEENIRSWSEDPLPYTRLVLRYEQMRTDINGTMATVCRFLGVDTGDAAIQAAIDRSSLEALRALEEAEIQERRPGIFFNPDPAAAVPTDARFVGGSRRDPLSPAQREAAIARFLPMMEKLGYRADPVT